jgi:tRNA 2-thiouridine synthesizing protein C
MSRKTLLVIVRRVPYAGALAYEALEAVLVAGVFEQEVTVVFMDDGVYQLLRDQNANAVGVRNVGRGLRALETYDVKQIYVDAESLAARGLRTEDLEIAAAPLDVSRIRALIPAHDAVITA